MQRIKLLVVVVCALVVVANPAFPQAIHAASNRNTSVGFGCQWFSVWYDLTIDRDNSENLHAERLRFLAMDGSGRVIYSHVMAFAFSGQSRQVSDPLLDSWSPRPQYNPLTFQIISLPGNGLPQQLVYARTGRCPGLPPYAAASRTPTLVPSLVPDYTPTPVVGNDLTITGKVTNAMTGNAISGVNVSINTCHPRDFRTTTAADGTYSLFLPSSYNCGDLPIGYTAPGYTSCYIRDGLAYITDHGTMINVSLLAPDTGTPVLCPVSDYTPSPVPSKTMTTTIWPTGTLPPTFTPVPSSTFWPSGTPMPPTPTPLPYRLRPGPHAQ